MVSKEYFNVLLTAIFVLGYVDFQKYKGTDAVSAVLKQKWYLRIVIETGLLFTILLFGCYGVEYDTSEFIYFQF